MLHADFQHVFQHAHWKTGKSPGTKAKVYSTWAKVIAAWLTAVEFGSSGSTHTELSLLWTKLVLLLQSSCMEVFFEPCTQNIKQNTISLAGTFGEVFNLVNFSNLPNLNSANTNASPYSMLAKVTHYGIHYQIDLPTCITHSTNAACIWTNLCRNSSKRVQR